MIVLDAHGCFKTKEFSMIPYQHHLSKHTWKVVVTRKVFREESIDFEREYTNVFARSSIEAAKLGMEFFQRSLVEEEKLKEWEKIEAAKRLSKQLKQKDVSGSK